jgi:alpha-mannosidase
VPVYAAEPPSLALVKTHATRPEEESFFSVSPANVVMSGMKQAEASEDLIVRFFEVKGKETTATIKLPISVKTAQRLDLIEFPLQNATAPAIDGNTITIKLRSHEIVTLGIN